VTDFRVLFRVRDDVLRGCDKFVDLLHGEIQNVNNTSHTAFLSFFKKGFPVIDKGNLK
jgi:hypothetical protein